MNSFLLAVAAVLLLTLLGGLVRIAWGPTPQDRMLASQLMGTTGVGILLLLSQSLRQPSLVDVALVFSLLGAVATVAFVRWILLGCTRGEWQNDVD